jgi:hypothetical protein
MAQSTPSEASPAVTLHMLLAGMGISRAIMCAAQLGIADQFGDEASVAELARLTQTHAPSLYRLMRALASLGIFAEVRPATFAHTALSRLLRSDVPGSLRNMALLLGNPSQWQAWGALDYSVRTGQPAFDHIHGQNIWQYLALHPESARVFNEAMVSFSEAAIPVVYAYDFSTITTMVDVGGGLGRLLIAILQANPAMRGILLDQPAIIEEARARIMAAGLGERCELVVGDYFEALPTGADAYLFKQVLHNLPDEECIRLLTHCRAAMQAGGKVLIVEQAIRPGSTNPATYLQDLDMLVAFGGRERTEEEFRALFEASRFILSRFVQTRSPYCLVEGTAQ